MSEKNHAKLASYLKLLKLHRGEARDSYDEVAAVYDEYASVWDGFATAPARDYFNQLISERIADGAVVLDAGSGTGNRIEEILVHSQPSRVVGLEPSSKMLSKSRKKITNANVAYCQGDIRTLPFPDNSFDVVTCTWVIEILEKPNTAVQEFLRVIKPDGIVMVAFSSLPRGKAGEIAHKLLEALPNDTILNHLLPEEEWPLYDCDYSSLKQFRGGLMTVATVSKCSHIGDVVVP